MARKSSPRIAPTATPRHFWLAGLGFVSIASRRTVATAGEVAGRAVRARQDVLDAMQKARSRATTATVELRDRIEAGADRLNTAVEQALSPLVAKLRPAGKGKGKGKRVARRASRKPVAKNARRTAPKAKVARRTRRG
jgi:hypothetical protein